MSSTPYYKCTTIKKESIIPHTARYTSILIRYTKYYWYNDESLFSNFWIHISCTFPTHLIAAGLLNSLIMLIFLSSRHSKRLPCPKGVWDANWYFFWYGLRDLVGPPKPQTLVQTNKQQLNNESLHFSSPCKIYIILTLCKCRWGRQPGHQRRRRISFSNQILTIDVIITIRGCSSMTSSFFRAEGQLGGVGCGEGRRRINVGENSWRHLWMTHYDHIWLQTASSNLWVFFHG